MDAGQSLETRRIHAAVVADEADRRALRAGHGLRLIAQLFDDGDDLVDFVARGSMPHHDQHV